MHVIIKVGIGVIFFLDKHDWRKNIHICGVAEKDCSIFGLFEN